MTSLSNKSQNYLNAALEAIKAKGFNQDLMKPFQDFGLPTKKNENYKYTNLEKSLSDDLKVAKHSTLTQEQREFISNVPGVNKLIFLNGRFLEEESQISDHLQIDHEKTTKISPTADIFDGFTQALSPETTQLTFSKNTKYGLTSLIYLINTSRNETSFSNLHVTAETSSEAQLMEVVSSNESFDAQSFSFTHLELKPNAKISHTKAILTSEGHIHIGKVQGELERDSHLFSLSFLASGKVNRNNIEFNINGEGAHATVNGLYAARDEQHHDNFTHIHHRAPHTTSDQIFKGILDDKSHGIFTGKIVIHRDAQKVDSSQLNKNLLLSQKAHVDTRPQIEVYADDVKCGHGATVGQINQEEVFYLESRGLPKAKAQKILCHAFGQEVIDSHPLPEVKTFLSERLFDEFEKFALEKLDESESRGKY